MVKRDEIFAVADRLGAESAADYSLAKKTSYKTGGNADMAFFPDTAEKARGLITYFKTENIPFVVLGGGNNVLVSDDGFRGAVVLTEKLRGITVKGKTLVALAGEPLTEVLKAALYSSLGGMEFLSGIPAFVGGAVAMNAGRGNKSVGDYVSYVVCSDGIRTRSDCAFGYRESVFSRGEDVVLSVCFNLDNVEFDSSELAAEKFLKQRAKRTPKGRSCGSVFKNDGYFAGKLVEQSGLKGRSIGGARVSEKHANFIIAEDGATSSDIRALVKLVKATVKEKTGIELKEEVKYIGEFDD